jgi:hypothetical protein
MNRDQMRRRHETNDKDEPRATAPGKSTLVERISRKADGNGVEAHAGEAVAQASSSSGTPLPADLQHKFEGSLGANLSNVRVHTGSDSARAAASVGARAYTTGNDIHFNDGQYDPHSAAGQHLLAHEVAHTVQQSQPGGPTHAQHKPEVSQPGDAHEHEADHSADAMLTGAAFTVADGPRVISRFSSKDMQSDTALTTYGQARVFDMRDAPPSDVEQVRSLSVVRDSGTALQVIGDIDRGTESLSRFPDTVAGNVETKFAVQAYVNSLGEGNRTVSNFQGAYVSAREDYERLAGMAAHYLKTKGIESGGSDFLSVGSAVGTGRLKTATQNAEGNSVFHQSMEAYEGGARGQLSTYVTNIGKADDDIKTEGLGLQTALYSVQSKAAAVQSDKAKSQLATIQAKVSAIAGTINQVLTLAGGAVSETFKLADSGQQAADALVDPERLGAVAKTAGEGLVTKLKAAGSKEATGFLGKGVQGIVEGAVSMFFAADIAELQSAINAANTEKELAEAAAEADQLAEKHQKMAVALKSLLTMVTQFALAKEQLRLKANKLVESAVRDAHDPELATAIRFMSESDVFIQQSRLAINMGKTEQTAAEEILAKRDKVSNRKTGERMRYHGFAGTYTEDGYPMAATHEVQLEGDKDLPKGDESLEGGHGATAVIARRVSELEDASQEIGMLRATISGQMGEGTGDVSANTSLTTK